MQRNNAVGVIGRILALDDQSQSCSIRQELALGLLQNLALSPQTHVEVLESPFMHYLPRFLGGGAHIFMRHKALAVVQHLSSNSENAESLFSKNIISLLIHELRAEP